MHPWLAFIRRHPGPLLALATAGIFVAVYLAAAGNGFGYYRRIAGAMLDGHLAIPAGEVDPGHLRDLSCVDERCYYPMGGLPALILLPGVLAMGQEFPQGAVVLALTAGISLLTYLLARRLNWPQREALWMVLSVTLGSPLLYTTLRATVFDGYLAHLVSLTCLMATVTEYAGKRRFWLGGALVGLSAMARPLTVLAAVFFGLAMLRIPPPERVRRLAEFTLPVLAAILLIAAYNTARFGNPLEVGYTAAFTDPATVKARQLGLFSWSHLPGNLYRLLLAGPVPLRAAPDSPVLIFPYLTFDGRGLALPLAWPLLFLLFRLKQLKPPVGWSLAAVGITAAPLLLSFAHGEHQYGARYAFDFLPFLVLALLAGLPQRLGRLGRALTLAGIGISAWLTLPVLLNLPGFES